MFNGDYVHGMSIFKLIGPLLILLGLTTGAAANPHSMTPLPNEELSQSLSLTNACSKVNIVEWRQDGGPNEIAKNKLNAICNKVIGDFPRFFKNKEYNVTPIENFTQSVSIIPIDNGFRNLNDIIFRFSTRSFIEYDENGDLITILGYHQRATSFIYIYNQVLIDGKLNKQFRTVFAHELFHALSYQFGIFYQHDGNKNETEEEMAQDFTEFMGYGR